MDTINIVINIVKSGLLTSISHLTMFIALAATFVIYRLSKQLSAFLVILVSINTLLIIHPIAEVYMLDLAKNQEETIPYIRHAWYWFFALTDIMAVQFSMHFCRKWNLSADRFSTYILYAFLTMAALQVVRWLDRIVFETELLGTIYMVSIPLINISVAAATIAALVLATSNYQNKKGIQ